MRSLRLAALVFAIAFASDTAFAAEQQKVPCSASQLSLAIDSEGGNFDGMSHSGTLLVLRNISPAACTVAGYPVVRFLDTAGKELPIVRETPSGMHPGPVMTPATVVSGAELTSTLRWVSGDVYTLGECFEAASLSVAIGAEKLTLDSNIQQRISICGPKGKVTFTMSRMAPDPTEEKPVH